MSRKIIVAVVVICAGCALAPLGFYESAFPAQKHFSLRGGIDVGRSYDDIPNDSGTGSYEPSYHWPMTLIGIDYSPVSYLTLGGEITGPPLIPSAWGAGLKAKAVPIAGENTAAALLLRVGTNQSEESDSWGGHRSYSTQYLVAGGIVSIGSPVISFGVGPKVALSHVNINISGDNSFNGNVVDYGGFLNLVLNYGFFGLAAEASALSVDRPNAGTRSFQPYGGGMLKIMF